MPDRPTCISIVITVRNEASNLEELFEGLSRQSGSFETVIVDSESTDGTPEIVARYSERLGINYIVKKCTRGEGRNIGVSNSSCDFVVFIDGDVTLEDNFVEGYSELFSRGFDVIAGKVVPSGVEKFKLGRVELLHGEIEITHPSANLGYRKDLFRELGGFDPAFITAEDIDLNLRAARSGARFTSCDGCVVHNKTRSSYREFARQAYWNGYGRGQLKRKNSAIWSEVRKGPRISGGALVPNLVRLGFGALGYIASMLA